MVHSWVLRNLDMGNIAWELFMVRIYGLLHPLYLQTISLVNWFKFNTIRYFEINVEAEKNWSTRLHQGGLDYNFSDPNNKWNQKYSFVGDRNSIIWSNSIGICQGQLGHSRKGSGDVETKTREAAGRYGFFISEVRNHYYVLNRYIYERLSVLGLYPIINKPQHIHRGNRF